MARTNRRKVRVGEVEIGGDAPISIQSMTCTDTRDVSATVAQIHTLEQAGCEMVRVAVPDMTAAECLGTIRQQIHIPLIADIHFDFRLALEAIEQEVDKLRINPGNLRSQEDVVAVAEAASQRGIPIRVGANAGSLPAEIRKQHEPGMEGLAQALVEATLGHCRLLEEVGFRDMVVSLKAFDVPATIRAYQLMAEACVYPLHLGITEAGPPPEGTIRSAVGIGALLAQGIGDTIRVSLTAPPEEEIRVGREILRCLEIRRGGVILISCPTCGRIEFDLLGMIAQVKERLADLDRELWEQGRELRVAVMGCVVNGPGEARGADIGIAGGKGSGVLFLQGEVIRKLKESEMVEVLVGEALRLAANH